jgi:hypothetical protein
LIRAGIDHGDAFAGAIEVSTGIERRQQILAHVKLLGQALARAV